MIGKLGEALDAVGPDYVVLANETAAHKASLDTLAGKGFTGDVLVEKPLFSEPAAIPKNRFRTAWVGYNLRFHPLIERLRDRIHGQRLLTASIYVGQWLPDWRPGRPPEMTASATPEIGGGVLRDLSHELDLALLLFGECVHATALGISTGSTGVKADDAWSVLLECDRCRLVTIQMNYFDRPARREILVNTAKETIHADLVSNRLTVGNESREAGQGIAETYAIQHGAVLSGGDVRLCDLSTGARIVNLIADIEKASDQRCWVNT